MTAIDDRGVACHCGSDDAGHAPGTRGCEPVKAGNHPTGNLNTLSADLCGALAKTTRDKDYARRLRASAAILREARKARYHR